MGQAAILPRPRRTSAAIRAAQQAQGGIRPIPRERTTGISIQAVDSPNTPAGSWFAVQRMADHRAKDGRKDRAQPHSATDPAGIQATAGKAIRSTGRAPKEATG